MTPYLRQQAVLGVACTILSAALLPLQIAAQESSANTVMAPSARPFLEGSAFFDWDSLPAKQTAIGVYTYEKLMDKWLGNPLRLHLDSWIELKIVDGQRVFFGPRRQPNRRDFIS
jgi:hypothetical protein